MKGVNSMKNKLVIIAIIAIIGFLTTCSNGSENPPPSEHIHQWGDWTVTTAATCTTEGSKTRTCALDPLHTETEAVPIDPTAHNYLYVAGSGKAPTCTEDGNGNEVCTYNPSHTKSGVVIPALGHNYTWETITHATCSAKGSRTGTCTRDANHTMTEEIPIDPTAHDWEQLAGIAPTCTETGSGKRRCKICLTEETLNVIPALGHNWEWVKTTDPTYTTEGVETKICTRDPSHTDGTCPIPQIPFTTVAEFKTWLDTQPDNTIATAYNVKLNVSDLGGYSFTAGSAGEALFDNPTKYVSLDLSGMTSIGSYAFNSCSNLTSVIIPNV
jgi:hypothetical protein